MKLARITTRLTGLMFTVCLLWAPTTFGQTSRRLEGRILDQSGGNIPGAKVTLSSDEHVQIAIANDDGEFSFTGLVGSAYYLEVSSPGFFSTSMPISDKTPDRVSITLSVWECTQCVQVTTCPPYQSPYDQRNSPVNYEERRGREQLTGTIGEISGPPLANASLNLMKADPKTGVTNWPISFRSHSMQERGFRYMSVAQTISNERGEFQFVDLEPGWYSLEAERVGYYRATLNFWIARETLTRPSRIEMFRIFPNQMPNVCPTPSVETPAPIKNLPLKSPSK